MSLLRNARTLLRHTSPSSDGTEKPLRHESLGLRLDTLPGTAMLLQLESKVLIKP